MYREYVQWGSTSLERPMELLWFGQFGRPVLIFPTSRGRFFQAENAGLVEALADKVERGEVQLVCVDSVDSESWFDRDAEPPARVIRHNQYDRYLRDELVPYVFNRAQRGDLVVYGASFGAFHAANFAARYPDVVSRAISFSGVYDVRRFLDGHFDETAYFHCPPAYIANMDAEWVSKLSRVNWVFGVGEHDQLAHANREFSELLWSKGIPNQLEIWSGVYGHAWRAWGENLRRFV